MAQNAKDIQLRDLKDLTNELRETNRLLKSKRIKIGCFDVYQ